MSYLEIIPLEILDLIIIELDLKYLPKLARSNKYFNNINFQIESKINSTLPEFILLNKWATMIYSKNPKFLLPKKININLLFWDTILIQLIKKNSTNGIKMLFDYSTKIAICSQTIVNIALKHDYFSYVKQNVYINYIINQPLLVLTLLYGTEDMLNFLLKSNIIKSVNNYKTISLGCDPKKKNTNESENLFGFIDNMELKNKWNVKSNIYKKVSLTCIFREIVDDNISRIKSILDSWDKEFFNNNITSCQFYTIPYLYHINITNLIHRNDMKIKHILLFIASPIRSKINQIKNWYYSETMLNTIFNCFEWDDDDIILIKKVDKDFNFGVGERIFL
jgi:hypothetical protein